MSYWIVEKRDDAIMGFVSGVQSQDTIDGPFETFGQAQEVKSAEYRSWGSGSYYYTIIESNDRPKSDKRAYEFTDAQWEFDDV